MSCSDKIILWNVLGLQGQLLGTLLNKPLYLSTIIIECDNNSSKANVDTIKRGLIMRDRLEFHT